jgi:hypothetical protein
MEASLTGLKSVKEPRAESGWGGLCRLEDGGREQPSGKSGGAATYSC